MRTNDWIALVLGVLGGAAYYSVSKFLDGKRIQRMKNSKFTFEFRHSNGSIIRSNTPFTLGEIKVFSEIADKYWRSDSELREDQSDVRGGAGEAG